MSAIAVWPEQKYRGQVSLVDTANYPVRIIISNCTVL